MAQLSIAWVLQNKNVASAIMGGVAAEAIAAARRRRPSSSGEPETIDNIDAAIGSLAERDPAQTKSPASREA